MLWTIIISFGVFHLRSDNIYENVVKEYRSYNVRPFAFLSDAYIFSWFWDNMYALLFIMLILHVCNLFFVYKICEKIGVRLTAFCLTLFAVSPILIEAIYWISASTRIVFSLFLCLASIYLLLMSFDEENKTKRLIAFLGSIVINLVCVGFYEQTIALNLFLFCFVLICLKKYKYMFIPAISTFWIGVWYIYFIINGEMQERGALNLGGIFSTTLNLVNMVYVNFKNAYSNFIYSLGFAKEVIFSTGISILLFVLFSCFVYYIYKNNCNKIENKGVLKKIILAFIFALVPFLPFIILDTKFIAVRNLYFAMFGLAIFVEIVLDLILGFIKSEKAVSIIKTGALAFVMFFFILSNIDGVNNYRKVNDLDNKVVEQIIESVGSEAFGKNKSISINYDVNKLPKYKNLSNYVESVIESDWAMIGKLQVARGDTSTADIYINSMQDVADYVLYFDENMNLVK